MATSIFVFPRPGRANSFDCCRVVPPLSAPSVSGWDDLAFIGSSVECLPVVLSGARLPVSARMIRRYLS